jgi:hypothetical protein
MDKTADCIDLGPIRVGLGYRDWVGRFRNKLKSTIGAATFSEFGKILGKGPPGTKFT